MLHFAVFSNHINIVRYLVEDWGVDVNQLSNVIINLLFLNIYYISM